VSDRRDGLLFGAALLLVPRQWRQSVRHDLEEDIGGRMLGRWWGVVQVIGVAILLHWAFTREGVMDEIRLAIRRLVKQPGASMASLLTLACSIGAAAATWSLVSAVLLHPIPVDAPGRIAVVGVMNPSSRDEATLRNRQIYPLYHYLRESGVFESVAAGGSVETVLIGTGGVPQPGSGYFASPNFFDLLGVRIAIGRGFTEANNQRGGPLVAVLSDRFWRRALNADSAAIGRDITVSGKPVTVIGIAPAAFRGVDLAQLPDIYMPIDTIVDVGNHSTNYFADASRQESPTAWVTTFVRLKPGTSAAQAAGQLAALPKLPEWRSKPTFGLTDVDTAALPEAARADMNQFGRLLAMTVGLLLVIGCLTVGMLVLIRTEARRDEFAMCLALGATRGRLARGVAVEGAVLSLGGAVLAMPVAWWLLAGARAFQLPGGVDIDLLNLSIDSRALAAATSGAVAATLLIALVAGGFGLSANIADVLRSRSGGTPRLTRRRTRSALVSAQVAVAVVLLLGTGLFARSLVEALHLNPGFDTGRIVTSDISLLPYGYTAARGAAFFSDLRDRLGANPAIRSLSLKLSSGGMTSSGKLTIDGVARQFPSTVAFVGIDDRYFATMGIRIVKGRNLTADDRERGPRVMIVSESFGRLLANGGDPTGHRITETHSRIGQPPDVIEVVGVAADVITNVNTLEPLVMYMPVVQLSDFPSRTLVMRAAGDPSPVVREAMAAVKQSDPRVTPGPMLTMDERIGKQMSSQRFGALVMGALAVIAVLLTVLGIYVLAESMAVLRTREMGIRAALGATGRQLGGIVLAETARLVGIGLAAGLLFAWMEADLIRSFLFRIKPFDPITIGGVTVAIVAMAVVVSLKPALRAARVDLAQVLRDE
jgi:putative ABC transport system permease protein